jgi:hypothetical protein
MDYPGSHPHAGGSLHPATTHYNGTMCTDYNDGVSRYAIYAFCLKGSSRPAYKGARPRHHVGSMADTIRKPRLILRLCLDLQVVAMRMSSGICLMLHGSLESAMAWARLGIRHGMADSRLPLAAFSNTPWHGSL